MGMASHIKKGESILIPFRNGQSIADSQLKPRMYKTMQAFEKSFPGYYLGTAGVELVEYAEVVRCKDCKHWKLIDGLEPHWECQIFCGLHDYGYLTGADDFCSYGERKEN